jgi:hypothetical protein
MLKQGTNVRKSSNEMARGKCWIDPALKKNAEDSEKDSSDDDKVYKIRSNARCTQRAFT